MCNRYPKTSSVESDQSSAQEQEFPLDLSLRSSVSSGSTSDSLSLSLSTKNMHRTNNHERFDAVSLMFWES